jgi:phosphoserine phosphatase RsbU/P
VPTTGIVAPAILQSLPDVVVVADAEGRIVYTNPAVGTLLGHEPADLRGRPLTVLVPERFRTAHRAGFARFVATGAGQLFDSTLQLPALHRDGSEVLVDLTLSPLDVHDELGGAGERVVGGVVVAVLRDASTAVRLERQLEVGRYLTATLRVTAALAEAPDADVAFEQLLPSLCAELDWHAATLWQPEACGGRLAHAASWSAPGETVPALQADTRVRTFVRGEGLPGTVWQRRAPVVVEDLWADPGVLRRDAVRADDLRTGVAFPVLHGDTLLGVCELFAREQRPVPAELLDVLASAGRQIGQFLARLRAESELRELADTLQRSLLPAHLPTIPGMQLAARYRAGADGVFVGGDTYDVLPLGGGRWMVLIADVCGTGAEAAALTALTRHTARAAASSGGGPGDVLAAVNTALLREQDGGRLRFVTAACLVLEPRDAGVRARLVVAGHPRPLLRAADGTIAEVGVCGRPLGVEDGATWTETPVELCCGSTLVLYTDGVTEARDDAGEQFGEERLAATLAAHPFVTAAGAVAAVHAAVGDHVRGSRHGADDLAVLALRC